MTTQFIVWKGFNKVHKCSPNVLKTTFHSYKIACMKDLQIELPKQENKEEKHDTKHDTTLSTNLLRS